MNNVNIKAKVPVLCVVAVTLVFLMLLPGVFSAGNQTLSIQNSGRIASLSPLHVDGRYIKDTSGNIVDLRGCGKIHWDDDPTGWWLPTSGAWYQGYLNWNEQAITLNFDGMRSFGMNIVRFHTVAEWWLQDNVTFKGYVGSYRYNLKRTIELAVQRGLYVVIDLFLPMNGYWYSSNSYSYPGIPFSPYVNRPEEQAIFPNQQAFASYWANVANDLKNYPNVIFELYNEPNAWEYANVTQARNDWFNAMQLAINAIRQTGSTNLVLAEWGLGVVPNSNWQSSNVPTLDWISHANLNDTTGNLVYAAHMYRTYYNPGWYYDYNYTHCYDDMVLTQIPYVLNSLNKPVVISEIGANMWSDNSTVDSSGLTELQKELAWTRNIFNISNQWGVGYMAWEWSLPSQWGLIASWNPAAPSPWGQVLIDAIAQG